MPEKWTVGPALGPPSDRPEAPEAAVAAEPKAGSPEQVLGRKPFEIPSLDAEDAAAGLMNIMGDKISATALGHLLSLKEEDAAAGREIYPGGMPPGLASIAQ